MEDVPVNLQAQIELVWRTDANPDVLLDAARLPERNASGPALRHAAAVYDRRYRLYGCACARMVWDLLPTDARSLVSISERFADGKASRTDLQASGIRMLYGPVTPQQLALNAAGWASLGVFGPRFNPAMGDEYVWNPHEAARSTARAVAARVVGRAPPGRPTTEEWQTAYNVAFATARAHQTEFVRDVFPPPGYAPRLDREWLTNTVLALARQMDETGDFTVTPILADALQDAGCDDDIILDRCRAASNIHCRGNWVVDLILG